MTNPYESPQTAESTAASGRARRWSQSIWMFAIFWPLICVCFHATAKKISLPAILVQVGLPIGFYYLLMILPVLFGYGVCIVAAVRYRSDRFERVVLAASAVVLMMVSGNLWKIMMDFALSSLFGLKF